LPIDEKIGRVPIDAVGARDTSSLPLRNSFDDKEKFHLYSSAANENKQLPQNQDNLQDYQHVVVPHNHRVTKVLDSNTVAKVFESQRAIKNAVVDQMQQRSQEGAIS
jgi:hypothetical protein